MEPFLSTLAGLPGSFPENCLGQLFERRAYSACFCRKELQNNLYRRNFPELYKHERLKSVICKPAVSKQKLHYKAPPGIFPKFSKHL